MLQIIAIMFIGAFIVIVLSDKGRFRYLDMKLLMAMVSTMIAFMILLAGLAVWNVNTAKVHQTFNKPISSISTGTITDGHFFLGSGTIDQDPVYYFWQSDGKGYTLGSVWAYGTTLIEDATPSTSHVEQTCRTSSKAAFSWFEYKADCTQTIHVPPHTVVKTYDATLPH